MPHPFFEGLVATVHISHRGGAALAPENTVEAFRLAVEAYDTDILELDLQQTRDGVLVVAHDETVDRCTDGRGRIETLALTEIQALDAGYRFTRDGGRTFPFREKGIQIPTFSEVLCVFPRTRMNVDLKVDRPGIEFALAEAIRTSNAEERVCCGSEMDALAERIAQALPDACRFYPKNAGEEFVRMAMQGVSPPLDERYRVLDIPLFHGQMRLITPFLLEVAARCGRWINVWTVDDVLEMRRLRFEGVGGIMTDRPDLLRRVLNETGAERDDSLS